MSFGVTPGPVAPSNRTRMVRGRRCRSVWVASACTNSDEPTPKASAPTPPLVQVWLSPQISVSPGSTMPCSGAMTWTMP